MTMDADMSTSTLMQVTRIRTITMLITQTSMGPACLTMTMPVIMCTRIQIHIPSIPTITVSTIVLIAAIAMPLWNLHSRIPIHSPVTITNDKRVSLCIPTRMCMSIPRSHILIPALHPLTKSKPNTVRSLPQSGNENLILAAHHFKLGLKPTKHP